MKNFDTTFWINYYGHENVFQTICFFYDVSNEMVSKPASQKNLKSNPKPPFSPDQKENQTCAQKIKRFFKKCLLPPILLLSLFRILINN